MIGRVNFTNRKRIRRDSIGLVLDLREDPSSVEVSVSLEGYGFEDSAQVFLEAYRHARLIRFDLGSPPEASSTKRYLLDHGLGQLVLFRVKVVDATAHPPRILGEADRLVPELQSATGRQRVSLLPVVPEDLGEEVWQIGWEAERPVLRANRRIHGIVERISTDQALRSLVFPAVLRQILLRVLIEDQYDDDEEGDSWAARWIRFAAQFGEGRPPAIEGDEPSAVWSAFAHDWIETAVAGFAEQFRAGAKYAAAVGLAST